MINSFIITRVKIPEVLHQRRSYVPCDLALIIKNMKTAYEQRQNICKNGFSLSKDRPALDNTFNKFLAFNHTTSLLVAQQSCAALGLHLPEIRTKLDIKELKQFMASEAIGQVYAGINFDKHQNLPIFATDQQLANESIPTVRLIDDATNEETTWGEVTEHQKWAQHYRKTGIHFTYRADVGLGIQLRIHYAGQIGLRPICFKYKGSYDPRDTNDWRNNCMASQRHLRALIRDTDEVVRNIFPKSIKRAPQHLPYMIDRYHNPIQKRSSTQSLYEEILNAPAPDNTNTTICQQIFKAENLNVGLFGERKVIREEIYGNSVTTFHLSLIHI